MERNERRDAAERQRALAARRMTIVGAEARRRIPHPQAGGAVLPRGWTIAVLPFGDLSGCDDAARVAAALATVELRRRAAFCVIEPWQTRARLLAAGVETGSDPGGLVPAARLIGADAMLAGTVTAFDPGDGGRAAEFGITMRVERADGGPPLLVVTGRTRAEAEGTAGLRALGRRTVARLLSGLRAVEH